MTTNHLSEQSFRVLRRLRGLFSPDAPFVNAEWLAADTQMPAPSLRRCVRELRLAGFSVVHDHGCIGLLFLGELMRRHEIEHTWAGLVERLR